MENRILCLKVNTYLVEREKNLALFYVMGNHVYIRDSLVDETFERLCLLLSEFTKFEKVLSFFPGASIEQIESRLQILKKNHLLINTDSSILTHIEVDSDSYKKSFAANFYPLPQVAKKYEDQISETEIYIVDLLGLKDPIQQNLSMVGFKRFHILNENNCLEIDSYKKRSSLSLRLVIGNWKSSSLIGKINSFFFSKKEPWLLVLKDLFGGQIGPYFSAEDSPCFECLIRRKGSFLESHSANSLIEKNFFTNNRPYTETHFPVIDQILSSWTAMETYKLSLNLPSPKVQRGGVLIDALNLKTKYCELFPAPFCEVCSDVGKHPIGSITTL